LEKITWKKCFEYNPETTAFIMETAAKYGGYEI